MGRVVRMEQLMNVACGQRTEFLFGVEIKRLIENVDGFAITQIIHIEDQILRIMNAIRHKNLVGLNNLCFVQTGTRAIDHGGFEQGKDFMGVLR
ncbi:hypothetical protein D3C75_931240 [compost metagenome]